MIRFGLLVSLIALVAVAGRATVARADASRIIGPYVVTVGFTTTPVYSAEPNPLIFRFTDAAMQPVTGLEDTLRVRVSIPNQVTETMPVDPVAGQPGVYRLLFLPPRATIFQFNLLGTIREQTVDEKFFTERDLDKVITRGRQYPRGSWVPVVLSLAFYVVGLAVFGVLWLKRRFRTAAAVGSRQ